MAADLSVRRAVDFSRHGLLSVCYRTWSDLVFAMQEATCGSTNLQTMAAAALGSCFDGHGSTEIVRSQLRWWNADDDWQVRAEAEASLRRFQRFPTHRCTHAAKRIRDCGGALLVARRLAQVACSEMINPADSPWP